MSAEIDLGLPETEIDLSRHGIVEAHAGTGKTWTIVNRIAMPLLCSDPRDGRRFHVRELLLVTYTDKAAGELRGRLREAIEARLAGEPDLSLREHLEDCLKSLGEAWIGTIHSTALRILRMFPFESSLPLRTEIVDDADAMEDVLDEVLRAADGPWAARSARQRNTLGEAGLEGLSRHAADLAPLLLDPDAEFEFGSPAERARLRDEAASRALPAWTRLLDRIRSELLPSLGASPKSKKVGNLLAKWRDELQDSAPPARIEELSSLKSGTPDFSADKPDERPGLEAWNALEAMWAAEYEPFAAPLRDAAALANLGDREVLQTEFVRDWARAGADRWSARKRERGHLSYADMVAGLAERIGDRALLDPLRARIRLGVIDEFQDTGRGAWKIFRRWFLEGSGGGTLFVVGDPKQSIYSFQGADLGGYFRACAELEEKGAVRYVLRRNFRSVAPAVDAANALLTDSPPWFGPGSLAYESGRQAQAALRVPVEDSSPPLPPVRVFRASGSAPDVRGAWAREVASDIASLRGRTVRLPKGDGWESEHPLEWGDFAIVVPARSQARLFADALGERGIPWAFYKQEGVFSSRAAREWRALLLCLDAGEDDLDPLRTLSATRVFGIPAGAWDPAVHRSGAGSPGVTVSRWRMLALKGRWSELLRAASLESGWSGRILSGPDPDRRWMDHRQVREWLHRELRSGSGGLREAAVRLARLAEGDEKEGEDRNLFQRATDQLRVQILTMHASKGLEFPVVYLGGGRSNHRATRGPSRWTTPEGLRMRPSFLPAPPAAREQEFAESRRLLYVALTRPRLACAVPLLLDSKGAPHDALGAALAERESGHAGLRDWSIAPSSTARDAGTEAISTGSVVGADEVRRLELPRRTWRQASFTAISRDRTAHTLEGRPGRSEEGDEETISTDWLPRGARTGDALHELLERLLAPESDLRWVVAGAAPPEPVVQDAGALLWRHGLGAVDPRRVLELLSRTLGARLELPGGIHVRIAEIPVRDRRCEVEFLRGAGPDGSPSRGDDPSGWLVGHIDLLFRVDGIWYTVDWKSNDLPGWSPADIERAMREHRYDLQAALYAQAVRDALPGERFGGCAWIFLRGATSRGVPAWTASCDASGDAEVDRAVAAWRRREESPWMP